ncbi:hypothetical protein TorRG33x02_059760 [Trema orientale]|uniref:Uncharacterized protein n=1 Tax=Trema orientale TaxID=63057 RepID=A0A2P5FK60_TREOI|nr:hypothetical protein TorRG33x02_059760 [Trema orientale]
MGYSVWSDWSAFILGDRTMLYGTSSLTCSMVLSPWSDIIWQTLSLQVTL